MSDEDRKTKEDPKMNEQKDARDEAAVNTGSTRNVVEGGDPAQKESGDRTFSKTSR